MSKPTTIELSGRHALVTGGSRGIGRAIAAAFVAAGATVTITGRTEAALADAVAAGHAHRHLVLDACDEAATHKAFAELEAAHGPVDILVANAGTAETLPFLKADAAHFRRMIEANLVSVVASTQSLLPGMIARGHGRVIAIASTAGLKGYGHMSAYVAAKHAVVGLVRSLALETAKTGVTINAVCPGYTDTDLVAGGVQTIADSTGMSHDDALAKMIRGVPIGRLIAPDEVAAACLYLAGPLAGAVTGSTLTIAGGEL